MILRKSHFPSPCKAGFPLPSHHGNQGSLGTSATCPLLQVLWNLRAEKTLDSTSLVQLPCCIPSTTFSCSHASEDGGLPVSSSFHLLMLITLFPVLNENTLLYSFSSWVCTEVWALPAPSLLLSVSQSWGHMASAHKPQLDPASRKI